MTVWRWRLGRRDARLQAELQDHLARQVAAFMAEGVDEAEARRRARLAFGGALQVAEACRDTRRTRLLAELAQDVRFGLRLVRRQPLVAASVIVALALGIGANAAVFSVVDSVLLRQIAVARPDDLAVVRKGPIQGEPGGGMAPANAIELSAHAGVRTLAFVAAFANNIFLVRPPSASGGSSESDATLPRAIGFDEAERVPAMRVSAGFFAAIGVVPAMGRPFDASDDRAGAAKVAIISHDLWRRLFAADPHAVGRTVDLGQDRVTVIGVMPATFRFPELFGARFRPQIWVPLAFTPNEAAVRGAGYMFAIVRRQPEQPWSAVQAELSAISRGFARVEPRVFTSQELKAVPLHEQVVGNVRLALLLLWGAVACVLLAACANVAHILLSRATARSRELAVRTSLGATRARLLRQLLTESLVLGAAGAAMGLLLAVVLLRASVASGALELLPRAQEVTIDQRVLLFTTLAAMATSVLCGMLPALQLSRAAPRDAMERVSRGATSSGAGTGARALLVVGQIAAALVLAAGAGLLLRSFAAVQRTDLGFTPDGVLTMEVALPEGRYTPAAAATFFERLRERLDALPQVASSGAISLVPLSGVEFGWTFLLRDRSQAPGVPLPMADVRIVTPGALETMRVPLRRGRLFEERDVKRAQPVVVISESLARQSWPGEDPIGRQIKLEGPIDALPWLTVIGVVGDVRDAAPDRTPDPAIYQAASQFPRRALSLVLRTTGDPGRVMPAVREIVRALEPGAAMLAVRPLREYVSRAVAQRRFSVALLSLFAGIALMLALTGVYGILAYAVTRRTREIGIRLALGADRAGVLWMVMRQALALTALGLATGLVVLFAARRAIGHQLFGVTATDPATLGSVSLLMLVVAALASWLPARRAARVDPTVALRME